MPLKIIKTNERAPYRPLYHPFVDRHFQGDFVTDPKSFSSWSESPFFFTNIGVNTDGSVGSYAAFVITHEETYQKVLAGELREHEIQPLIPGSYGFPYLYWPSLILENRQHGPYLIKSIFREIENVCKNWELSISHVYSIAFTKVSERLMRRYHFTQAGTYGGKYPIMIAKVSENPYLRAFLP